MSNEILNDQIAELKVSLESVQAENKTLTDKLAEANVEKYEQSIEELNHQLKASAEQVDILTKELEDSKTNATELNSKLESVSEAHDKLESKIAEMDATEQRRSRKASLIEAGLSDEEAEAKIETFADLSDEQFVVLAETFAAYTKTPEVEAQADTSEVEETKAASDTAEDAEASEEKIDEEVLETAQAEEASTLVVESDADVDSNDGVEVVRAGLQDWVQTIILNNNSNSGE